MKKFKLILIVSIFSLLLLGILTSFKETARAQLSGYGSKCIEQFADCGEGSVNFVQGLRSGQDLAVRGTVFEESNVIDGIYERYSATGSETIIGACRFSIRAYKEGGNRSDLNSILAIPDYANTFEVSDRSLGSDYEVTVYKDLTIDFACSIEGAGGFSFLLNGIRTELIRSGYEVSLLEATEITDTAVTELANNMCVQLGPNGLTGDVIPYFAETGQEAYEVDTGLKIGAGLTSIYARMCPSQVDGVTYQASNAQFSGNDRLTIAGFGIGSYSTWGCCPAGYQLVTSAGQGGLAGVINSTASCCKIPEGSIQGQEGYPYFMTSNVVDQVSSLVNGTCADILGNPVWNVDGNSINVNNDTSDNYIITQNEIPEILGIKLGRAPGSVGTDGLDSRLTFGQENEGSRFNCGTTPSCAIVENADGSGVTIETSSGSLTIVNGTSLNESGASEFVCKSCYADGDPMAIKQADGTSKLVICNSIPEGDEDIVLERDLINNNIADTLAFYGTDSTNAEIIKNCRAQGGIPWALGCIDVSPTGIVTGLIRIALGVMGGVSLLQLILVGIRYQQGDEGEIKKAREQLIATITGLAVLIFSVLILRILGVNLLDVIPAGSI